MNKNMETTYQNGAIVSLKDIAIAHLNRQILAGVSLSIRQGEFVYIVGKTGAGKSTFLKLLYGELKANYGKGFIAGFELSRLTWRKLPKLRRQMGIISQDYPLLFDLDIYDNLKFVLKATAGEKGKKEIDLRIKQALSYVSLEHKIHAMPYELSTGEKQRIQIARALLNNAKIIIADEPTTNLDPETSIEIISFLHSICAKHNITFVVSTNDHAIIRSFPSRILYVQNGRINDYASLTNI